MDATRVTFTVEMIRKLKCPADKKQIFLWDTESRGLGVRITPTVKSFVFQGKFNGKTIRIKIGDVRTLPIDFKDEENPGARQRANKLRSFIDKGIDPRLERQRRAAGEEQERAEIARQELTLGHVWPEYLKDRKHAWSNRHYLDHVRVAQKGGEPLKRGTGVTQPGPLASLMDYKLFELSPDLMNKWGVKEAKKRATQTRIAFDALRAFINWCDDHKQYRNLIDLNSCSSRVRKNILPKKKAKSDTLQREQLKAWFAAVKGYHNQIISAYLQALLLTGARREELATLQWKDVDFKWDSITIKDKVEGERAIPLTPYVGYLLMSLPKKNRWVFSSPTSASGRLMEPRTPHNKALAIAGIEHLTLHGLRRSFGTLAEWVEVPVGVVYQIMGHKPSATAEKHYRNRPIDLLRKWHGKIEEWILEQSGIQVESYTQDQQKLRVVNGGKQ